MSSTQRLARPEHELHFARTQKRHPFAERVVPHPHPHPRVPVAEALDARGQHEGRAGHARRDIHAPRQVLLDALGEVRE